MNMILSRRSLGWLFLAGGPAVFARTEVDAGEGDDERQLRTLKTVLWPRAYQEQDASLLEGILDDRFEKIDAEGQRTTKEQELDLLRRYKPSYTSLEFEVTRLDIFPNGTAVVSGVGRSRGTDGGKPKVTTYTSSSVFVKSQGRWRAIASHTSGVKQLDERQAAVG
jgi:hypothetical protein